MRLFLAGLIVVQMTVAAHAGWTVTGGEKRCMATTELPDGTSIEVQSDGQVTSLGILTNGDAESLGEGKLTFKGAEGITEGSFENQFAEGSAHWFVGLAPDFLVHWASDRELEIQFANGQGLVVNLVGTQSAYDALDACVKQL